MQPTYRILVVDDDSFDNDRYCQLLASAGHMVRGARDVDEAMQAITQEQFDVVLLDMLLPARRFGRADFGGLEILRQIKTRDAATQVIAVTGVSVQAAPEGSSLGAG